MSVTSYDENEVDQSDSQFDLEPSPTNPPEDTVATPFGGVAPVDPLVYKEAEDSPELRPAAFYVQAAPRLTFRDPAPRLPEPKEFPEWTPGPSPVAGSSKPLPDPEKRSVLKSLFFLGMVILPVVLIGFALAAAVQLYQSP